MKHLFIINPAAGSWDHTKQYTAAIVESCNARGLDYRVEVSKAPGECRRITREAGETGEEYRVYACGGDGTLNEVASGAAGFPNLAITAYSGGSGNDFVRLFSEPAAFSDLERLLDAKEVTFDMIRCNDDYALNICSVGLDARIGTDVARYKRLPLLQGFRAYAASTVVNVVRGIAEHYVVEICGETVDAQQTMICVCNGRFYGGGFNPVPEADPTDGLLDVLLVKKVSRLQVSSIIGKYKNGKPRAILGHNLTIATLGVFILWIGWFGFNAGSAGAANGLAGMAFVNTVIATAGATLTWAIGETFTRGKPSMLGAASGAVAGLVTITPAAGFAGPMGSLVMGLIAGPVCLWGVTGLKRMLKVDDAFDAFGVHGVGGILGAILTGIVVSPALGGTGLSSGEYSMLAQLWIQFKSVIVTVVWSGVVSFIAYKLIGMVWGLRVSEDEEREGLDKSSHGESAYHY